MKPVHYDGELKTTKSNPREALKFMSHPLLFYYFIKFCDDSRDFFSCAMLLLTTCMPTEHYKFIINCSLSEFSISIDNKSAITVFMPYLLFPAPIHLYNMKIYLKYIKMCNFNSIDILLIIA